MKIFKSFFKKVEKNLLYPNHPNDNKIETEFKNNLKAITNEYGEDIVGLPYTYGFKKWIK